jgi:glycosyltransferase involved in cell wall biosynthesis
LQGDEELMAPSICVIAAGELTPDLSDQTLQDYQVLRVRTEAEALAGSGADAFLWLTSAGKLAPQALEECLWALQSADWATWEDTGAAPAPSMRDVAGPLGVSRRALEWAEPKPGGTVRRLAWRCITGPAERYAQESIPANGVLQTRATVRDGHWLSLLITRLQNTGVYWKQYVNRKAGKAVFDLSGYTRFEAGAAYANGLLLRPLRYAVVEKRDRRRVAVVVGSLGGGEAQRALLGVVEAIDRNDTEVIVITETSMEKRWKQRWLGCSEFLFEAGTMTEREELERVILSVALNWKIDALLIAEAHAAYRALPAIKELMPGVRAGDFVADLDAADLADSTIDSLDYRLARSQTVEKGLEGLALDQQQVRWIPYGVDLADGNGVVGGTIAIGFRGRLDQANGAHLLAAFAGELERLTPGAQITWVIAGSGPLETRLRQAFAARITTFVGDREPAVDLLVVLSEGSRGDWASLEALRRGTPVVAFHTDSRAEIVADGCGSLVTGGLDGEFRAARAVADLVQDRPALEAMPAAAQRHVTQNYLTANEIAQGRAFLDECLAEVGGKIQSGNS